MATRRVATAPAEDTPAPPRGADPDAWQLLVSQQAHAMVESQRDPEDDAEMELGERLRAAFGADPGEGARISISRRDPRTKISEWCGDYTPDQFNEGGLALVKQDFGAGHFSYRAYGSRGLITRGNFSIAETPLKFNPNAGGVSPDIARLFEQQTAMLAALAAKLEKPQETLRDKLDEMRLMREVFGPQVAAPAAPVQSPLALLSDMLAMQKMMRQLADEAAPAPAVDPDNPLSFLGPLLDVVKTGLASRGGAAPDAGPFPALALPASLSGPLPTPTPVPTGEPNTGNDSPDALAWRGMVAALVGMAQAGKPPAEGGELLYHTLPDEFIHYLKLPNWFEILAQLAPDLAAHRAWVEAAKLDADARFAESDAGG